MFYSVLFPTEESSLLPRTKEAPECFVDLNINKILKPVLQENPEDNSTDYGFKIHQKLPENQEETEACRLRLRTIPLIP